MSTPENWEMILNTQKDMAVLINENKHLNVSIKELVESIGVLKHRIQQHDKQIEDIAEWAAHRRAAKKTFWGVVRSEWYRVMMVSTLIIGFIVTNFEIVHQVAGR